MLWVSGALTPQTSQIARRPRFMWPAPHNMQFALPRLPPSTTLRRLRASRRVAYSSLRLATQDSLRPSLALSDNPTRSASCRLKCESRSCQSSGLHLLRHLFGLPLRPIQSAPARCACSQTHSRIHGPSYLWVRNTVGLAHPVSARARKHDAVEQGVEADEAW